MKKCSSCDNKADAIDNAKYYCAKCWIKFRLTWFKREQLGKHSRNK